MTYKTLIAVMVSAMLGLSVVSSHAFQGARGGGAGSDRIQQTKRDPGYEADRAQDRVRVEKADQDHDRDQVRDQGRDRIHLTDPSGMKDYEIYGNGLMTKQERKQYRNEMSQFRTLQERERYQLEHEKKMQQRALEQGKDLVPPGQGSVYGGKLMTVQERNAYREELRRAGNEQDRLKLAAQHREKMNERASALGFELEEAE